MIEAGKAAAIIVIAVFVVFIIWAKSMAGKAALRNVFGEPSQDRQPVRKQAAKRKKPVPRKRSNR